jgi:hypothetical protein
LADDADGLAHRVRKKLVRHRPRDGRARNLRRPSAHVAEHVDSERNVGDARDRQRLAVVDRLDFRKLFQMLLN